MSTSRDFGHVILSSVKRGPAASVKHNINLVWPNSGSGARCELELSSFAPPSIYYIYIYIYIYAQNTVI